MTKQQGAVATLAVALFAAVVGVTVAVIAAPAALAENVITVTITGDVVAADGQVSLREAFTTANTDGDDSRIVLGDNLVYRLCDGVSGTDEDANANGDLDHTDTNDLIVEGHGAEIRASCPGERVIHHLDTEAVITLTDLQVSGGDITDVTAPGSGLYSRGNTVITNVVFTDNTGAPGLEVGDEFGGSVDHTLTVTSSRFTDNAAGLVLNRGSGMVTGSQANFNQGSGMGVSFGQLTVTNSEARDNGGAGIGGIDGSVSVSISQVRNNAGGGVRNTGNSDTGFPLTVVDSIVDNNRGGGIDCSYCTNLTITGSTVTNNRPSAGGFGGGGARFQTNRPSPSVTIRGATITGNVSALDGGGVRARAEDGVITNVTITDSTISGNRTASVFDEGGGIYGVSINLTISDSHVDANFAKPEGILVGGNGGGIALRGGQLHVDDSTINDNFADSGGGGVYLVDVTQAVFTGSTVAGNVAEGFGGGGIQASGSVPSLVRVLSSTVAGNDAQLAGGGVAVLASNSEVEIEHSTISTNRSLVSNGGGLYMNGSAIDALVRNSTVSGNDAGGGQGGGILKIGSGILTTTHATIVENDAAAVANVLAGASTWATTATVVADPAGGGANCDVSVTTVVSSGYNFSGTNTCGFGAGPGDVSAGGDPQLGPLGAAGGPTQTHLPLAVSPLIDAVPAASCAVTIDQRGVARPQGTGCDIGSVEGSMPVAVADRAVARSGSPIQIDVIGNDRDRDRILNPATLRIIDKPQHGSAEVVRGRIMYRSNQGFVGTDRFAYEVCTGTQRRTCVRAPVQITVTRG